MTDLNALADRVEREMIACVGIALKEGSQIEKTVHFRMAASQWATIAAAIRAIGPLEQETLDLPDWCIGRKPTIGKHRAINWAHLKALVDRLDAAGDHEAADTIIWQAWWRKLDENRHEFLLADAREATLDRAKP